MIKDFKLDHETPHMRIQPEENRDLKTESSKRPVPLTGLSLEIALWIVENAHDDQVYAFERYNKHDVYANNSCSNYVNKFLHSILPSGTSHSFRHAMTDRLKESGTPEPTIKNLMGWSGQSMIDHYGIFEGLRIIRRALDRMHDFEEEEAYFTS